jgi:hypothetical protein
MRRRDGVTPKRPCRLRSIVRTAPPQDKCNQVIGWECSDPAEPAITSDTSDSLSDCDAIAEPPQLSGQEFPSRRSNRQLELRAWEVIQKEIDDFSESYALRTLPHFHFFGSFGNHGSYSLSLTKTSQSVYFIPFSFNIAEYSGYHLGLLTYPTRSSECWRYNFFRLALPSILKIQAYTRIQEPT